MTACNLWVRSFEITQKAPMSSAITSGSHEYRSKIFASVFVGWGLIGVVIPKFLSHVIS
jgi:hypothetical protein